MKAIFTLLIIILSAYSVQSSTFTSTITGSWSSASSWVKTAITGTNTIPNGNDDVVIASGHTIKLTITTNTCKSLTIDLGGTLNGNTKKLTVKGNFINNGSAINNLELFFAANALFSSASTFTCGGNIWVQNSSTLTFDVGTVVSKKGPIILQTASTKVVNNGDVSLLNNGAVLGTIQYRAINTRWTNASGARLLLQGNIIVQAAATNPSLVCTSSNNTVVYSGSSTRVFNTTYSNLTLSSAGSKSLTATLNVTGNLGLSGSTNTLTTNGHDINLGGNLTTTSSMLRFTSGDKINFNGAGVTQTVSGTRNTQFYDLEINNAAGGVVFNNPMTVTHDLIMIAGDCNSNNNLILQSNSSNTARIAPVPSSGCSFTGNMIIQKFIDDMPGTYYDLSSPTQNSNVMDWDNEIYISGVGTYDGQAGPQGVDGAVLNGQPSMHTYDEPLNTFAVVTGTNTTLSPGTGYQLLLAGDNINFWDATTIDSRGVPTFGDLTLDNGGAGLTWNDLGSGGGWHLVGNPYASYIDYAYMQANTNSGMTDNIYYTNGGAYSLWTFGNIPPFQGFYVETTQDPFYHAVVFTEACKTTEHTTTFHRAAANYDLKLVISSQLTPFNHENTIHFNSLASVNYDSKFDATYRKFPDPIAPAIYMMDKSINRNMIKNVINSLDEEVIIPLGIFTPKSGVYYLDASILNTNDYKFVWLENTKTGVKYDLNNSVAIDGTELGTNTDYVLRLSKSKQSSAIAESILETDLVIFNTENTINFKSTTSDYILIEVMVYDMTGKLVMSKSNLDVVAGQISKIDVSSLTSGIYVVSATDEQGRKTTRKLIK